MLAAPAWPLALPLPAAAAAQKVLRYAFRGAETSFDPAQDLRPVLAHRHDPDLRGALRLRPPGAAGASGAAYWPTGMPEVTDDFRVWTFRIKPRHPLRRRPGLQGPAARADRPTTSMRSSASSTRRTRARLRPPYSMTQYPRPGRAAQGGARQPQALRLRHAECRGLQCARPLHASVPPGRAAPALRSRARRRRAHRRRAWRARWSSSTATRSASTRSAPGRSASRAGRAARRIVLERNPTFRDMLYDAQARGRRRRGRRRSLARFKGRRLPMVDQVEISIIEESQPRWLAFLNAEIDALVSSAGSCRPSSPPSRCPTASSRRTSPSAASSSCARRWPTSTMLVLQHGRPGGRRLHAREGGAAPRHRAGLRRATARSADPPRPGASRRSRRWCRTRRGLRPGVQDAR